MNVPTWLNFDRATGRLSGKPQSGQEATYSGILISVTDGISTSSLPAFALTAVPVPPPSEPPPSSPPPNAPPPNAPPTVSGTPPTSVTEGKVYAFQPTASDANGDALTFSVANAPRWLTIDPATGRLSGTAPTGSAGIYSGIVISVTDRTRPRRLPASRSP